MDLFFFVIAKYFRCSVIKINKIILFPVQSLVSSDFILSLQFMHQGYRNRLVKFPSVCLANFDRFSQKKRTVEQITMNLYIFIIYNIEWFHQYQTGICHIESKWRTFQNLTVCAWTESFVRFTEKKTAERFHFSQNR